MMAADRAVRTQPAPSDADSAGHLDHLDLCRLRAKRTAQQHGRDAFLICSIAIGGSIFLILQLDSPFGGVMSISSRPIVTALAHMPQPPLAKTPQ